MSEDAYECIGICEIEPESGICLGCGRPLREEAPAVAAEALAASAPTEDQAGNKVCTSSAQ
jgi:hypothetical protein